eukprot:TRINITY_DN15323_c0_g1_i8.p1 TRINITY_DN15323_c0_g1~~TRINITY_DN15323_c0_g1_i8.p1  ORF type:complete len:386 (+),score=76.87 TRINITY_DN15323_c0_g1_i8:1089-2246(+)
MAGTPSFVMSFLQDLASRARAKADQELKGLGALKAAQEGQATMYPWDMAYYNHIARSENDTESLDGYFSIDNCLEGINIVAERLFGVRLVEVVPEVGETSHPSVRKMEVRHPIEGLMGHIYMDLLAREGKDPIQGNHVMAYGNRRQDSLAPQYHMPRLAVICSFESPMLSPESAEVLFHELGHAFHTLLSRNTFQHTSGTRGPADYVEIPSTFFERFALDPRVAPLYAKNSKSGASIPLSALQSFTRKRNMFVGHDMLTQIIYATVDQLYHARPPFRGRSLDIAAEVQNRLGTLPHVSPSWPARFTHFSGYAAAYYSYLLARVYSSNIWFRYFAADPLNKAEGERLRQAFLRHGSSIEPKALLARYIGDTLDMNCFTKDLHQTTQ